ncbi:MAG: hypothetical protein ACREPL_04860 [Rhodanobacteraceae bacterium]
MGQTFNTLHRALRHADTWGHPDLYGQYEGTRLLLDSDYRGALRYFKYSARYADKFSELSVGLMYADGTGVARNPVAACAWLELATRPTAPARVVATRNRVCGGLTQVEMEHANAKLTSLRQVYGDAIGNQRMRMALQLAAMESTGSLLGNGNGIVKAFRPSVTTTLNASFAEPYDEVAGTSINPQYFWRASWWNPQTYLADRNARWLGAVTVGAASPVRASLSGKLAKATTRQTSTSRLPLAPQGVPR